MKKLIHSELLKKRLTIEEAKDCTRHQISVMLCNIRSLYNVGSFFRTCDSALIEKLYLTGFTPHPPRAEITKTALGATETVPWEYYPTAEEAINATKALGLKNIAVELTDNGRAYNSLERADFPCCLIFGNEITGLDDEIIQLCDFAIDIPMYGVKHSLNVAVSGGIAIYSALEKYKEY